MYHISFLRLLKMINSLGMYDVSRANMTLLIPIIHPGNNVTNNQI